MQDAGGRDKNWQRCNSLSPASRILHPHLIRLIFNGLPFPRPAAKSQYAGPKPA